jgi:hypothetical protein
VHQRSLHDGAREVRGAAGVGEEPEVGGEDASRRLVVLFFLRRCRRRALSFSFSFPAFVSFSFLAPNDLRGDLPLHVEGVPLFDCFDEEREKEL